MFLDIIFYNIICYLLTYSSKRISLFPKVTGPQFFFNLQEFLKNYTSRYPFQNSNYFSNRLSCWKKNQNMNMIFRNHTFFYFKIKLISYLIKNFLYFLTISPMNIISIFRAQYKMIFCFINRMASNLRLMQLY